MTVWKIGQMVSIVDMLVGLQSLKKIGFERVLVDESIFGGSQRQLEVLVHIMASPFLIPSALLAHSSPALPLGSFG